MKLDSVMSAEAAEYAKEIARKGALEHSSTEDGENLAMGCTTGKEEMAAEEATKNWLVILVHNIFTFMISLAQTTRQLNITST